MRISHQIPIDAPADTVWAVTMDIERWPDWTPTVRAATRLDDGPLKVGSVARLSQPMQPVAEWVVTEMVPGRLFSWQTRRPGLDMIATHRLQPQGSATENTLQVDCKGALAWLLWPLLRVAIGRALADENRALKHRCEG
jgi:uncharacterized membrane protein